METPYTLDFPSEIRVPMAVDNLSMLIDNLDRYPNTELGLCYFGFFAHVFTFFGFASFLELDHDRNHRGYPLDALHISITFATSIVPSL